MCGSGSDVTNQRGKTAPSFSFTYRGQICRHINISIFNAVCVQVKYLTITSDGPETTTTRLIRPTEAKLMLALVVKLVVVLRLQ